MSNFLFLRKPCEYVEHNVLHAKENFFFFFLAKYHFVNEVNARNFNVFLFL